MKKLGSLDLTKGPIKKGILKLAFPIFLGNLFQQLYSIIDAMVVGKFCGDNQLAAITNTNPITFLVNGFFIGVFVGAGVIISRYFGQKNHEGIERAIHTNVMFAFIIGILITIFGVLFAPHIPKLMNMDSDYSNYASQYLTIIFSGSLALIMYNCFSGIFNAVGDTKKPLFFLAISSVLNIALDFLFVCAFDMGIRGAGFATVIAQIVSAVISFITLLKINDVHKLKLRKLKIDFRTLKTIVYLGLPAGIQNSVTALSNVFIQTNLNTFSSETVAGSGALLRLQGLVFIPIISFALAMTTFIGQNLGAKKFDRAKKGAKFSIITSMIVAETIGILMFFFSQYPLHLFSNTAETIKQGALRASVTALFYCFMAYSHCIAGILRGAGKAIIPMLVMLIGWCVVRIAFITIVLNINHDVRLLYMAYPLTWMISSLVFVIYYNKSNWLKSFENNKKVQSLY